MCSPMTARVMTSNLIRQVEMKRSNLSVAIYLLVVFLSGAVVGGFAHRLYMVKNVQAGPGRPRPEEFRQRYLGEMKSRLQMDDTQTARLNEILDRTATRFKSLRESHKPAYAQIHEEQVREINAILNDSQKAEYEKFRQEREKRRREMEGRKP
jgi:hypothetical protein